MNRELKAQWLLPLGIIIWGALCMTIAFGIHKSNVLFDERTNRTLYGVSQPVWKTSVKDGMLIRLTVTPDSKTKVQACVGTKSGSCAWHPVDE